MNNNIVANYPDTPGYSAPGGEICLPIHHVMVRVRDLPVTHTH